MTYDPVDSDDDGTVEADVDNSAVTTDTANISQVAGRMYANNTGQTISVNTFTEIQFNTVSFEDSDILTADTANNKVTISENGTYIVKSTITWAADSGYTDGDQIIMQVFDNSGEKGQHVTAHHGNNEKIAQSAATLTKVTGTHDMRVRVRHSSGSSKPLAGSDFETFIEVGRLG